MERRGQDVLFAFFATSCAFCFLLRKPWVRIASSVLSASILFPLSKPITESTLEAMRTQERFSLFQGVARDMNDSSENQPRRKEGHEGFILFYLRVLRVFVVAFHFFWASLITT